MCSGERPIGAAKGKQTNAMAACHPAPLQGPRRSRGCRRLGLHLGAPPWDTRSTWEQRDRCPALPWSPLPRPLGVAERLPTRGSSFYFC